MENAAAVAFQSSRLSKYPHFTLFPLSLHLPLPPMLSNRLIRVRAESEENAVSDTTKDATAKSSSGSGTGFGSTPASTFSSSSRREKKKRTREKDSVIRRNPINKSDLFGESQPSDQPQEVNESAFLLTWLGLGSLILIEGIALAASGFLPEAWDKFFVKYLYPSFTPTVFVFVGGTVVYGVFKYLQGEKRNS